MKRVLILLSAGLFFIFLACNDKAKESTGMSDKAQKNLDAFNAISKAFETGDASKLDSFVAADFVDHTDQGDKNRDSLKVMITMMKTHFPDMKTEVIKDFADDEYVYGHRRYTGTSDGSMGMPKGPYSWNSIEVVKFKDGKAVEHWAYMEMTEMMKMMAMPADTTKPK